MSDKDQAIYPQSHWGNRSVANLHATDQLRKFIFVPGFFAELSGGIEN